jgi:hypothetical protein
VYFILFLFLFTSNTHGSYFRRMVLVLSSPPFYTRHIQLPGNNNLCFPEIRNNSKFWPFFEDVLSALNGSHIQISNAPLLPIHVVYIEIGKGFFSQNCLFVSSFNIYFTYLLCGWEGAASNAHVFADAKAHDFIVPPEKYYLADAGFPVCDELIVLYITIWLSGAVLVSGE